MKTDNLSLTELIEIRQGMKREMDMMEDDIKNFINPAIGVKLALMDVSSVKINALDKQWSVVVANGQKTYINAIKLLEAGVSQAQIEKGTVRGKPYTSIVVKEIKAKGNGGSDHDICNNIDGGIGIGNGNGEGNGE